MKYQFCVRFADIDVNSSASKAVLDCNVIFSRHGYEDFTFTVGDNANKLKYYPKLLSGVLKFLFSIKRNSIVGIQYPLLSVNKIFKYLIAISKLKGVRFFCIVHDLESLRTGGKDQALIEKEISNLNAYDLLIVHNQSMFDWLKVKGVVKPMELLSLFDYLAEKKNTTYYEPMNAGIVYAGNLAKSTFIYKMPRITMGFTVYGPGCEKDKLINGTIYGGLFNPEDIVHQLKGKFGLIWDGTLIESCDEKLGNYLNYNNPHKASLYLAAGLPIIAPEHSAIGKFVLENKIGFTVRSLRDLESHVVNDETYKIMKANVAKMKEKITTGYFFGKALTKSEIKLGNA